MLLIEVNDYHHYQKDYKLVKQYIPPSTVQFLRAPQKEVEARATRVIVAPTSVTSGPISVAAHP